MRATDVCDIVDSEESTTTLGCRVARSTDFLFYRSFYPRWICGLIRPPTYTSMEYLSPHFIILCSPLVNSVTKNISSATSHVSDSVLSDKCVLLIAAQPP